jgi:hypothetical protein
MPKPPRARLAVNSRAFLILLALIVGRPWAQAAPPFAGTIFLDPDIITAEDPTLYLDLTDAGQGDRLVFDRRVNRFITINAYLFTARYQTGRSIEFQVNPEFGSQSEARDQALKYAPIVGRLPVVLLKDADSVTLHLGHQPFGGGNRNILIHTAQADAYVADGILEETLVHEAAHTSLDEDHAASSGWLAAQAADPDFISTYARDNPTREDVAETFLLYLASRHRSDRISADLANTIATTVPNRLAYFDARNFNLSPITGALLDPDPEPDIGPGNTGNNRIVNMSVRSVSGTGAETLNVGLVVGGTGTKTLLLRVVGPTLGALGVPGVVADPRLQLFRQESGANVSVAENDNWDGDPTLRELFSSLGAFALSSPLDATLASSLGPAVYPIIVDTKGSTGVTLVEAYDTASVTSGSARLVNVSARSQVGTGSDVLVAGFVVSGTGSKLLLIRGVGATLGDFDVPGVLANPQLIVRNSDTNAIVAQSADWNNNATITTTAQTLGAFALSSPFDSAVLVSLPPGVYTATVSGVNDSTGIALVEVYEVP